jgi:hypothetical protein
MLRTALVALCLMIPTVARAEAATETGTTMGTTASTGESETEGTGTTDQTTAPPPEYTPCGCATGGSAGALLLGVVGLCRRPGRRRSR